jgi:hypothetical protein
LRITITTKLVGAKTTEGSAFTAIASFFDDSSDVWSASTPTTAKYRIDLTDTDPSCWREVLAWTTLTPSTSISIPITASNNAMQETCAPYEPRQITVKANDGLSTQYEATYRYQLTNLAGT